MENLGDILLDTPLFSITKEVVHKLRQQLIGGGDYKMLMVADGKGDFGILISASFYTKLHILIQNLEEKKQIKLM